MSAVQASAPAFLRRDPAPPGPPDIGKTAFLLKTLFEGAGSGALRPRPPGTAHAPPAARAARALPGPNRFSQRARAIGESLTRISRRPSSSQRSSSTVPWA